MDFGRLVEHLNTVFGGDRDIFMRQMADFEHAFDVYRDSLFDVSPFKDVYRMSIAELPDMDTRYQFRGMLRDIFRTDDLLKTTNFDDISDFFKVVKAPTNIEEGFGRFFVPTNYFTDPNNTITPQVLGLINQTWAIDPDLSKGLSLTERLRPSGPVLRSQFNDFTADAMNQMRAGTFDFSNVKLGVLDIETAGLDRQGPWQIATRLMKGDELLKLDDIRIDNPFMDAGVYFDRNGTPYTSFKKFMQVGMGEGNTLQWATDFKDVAERMVDTLNEADYWVAHNAPFDFDQLSYAIQKAGLHTGDTDSAKKFQQFLKDIKTKRVIDTRTLANALLPGIVPAKELIDEGSHTLVSLENILMQTSLLKDIEQRKELLTGAARTEFIGQLDPKALRLAGNNEIRAAIYSKILSGVHEAGVDTFFEHEFLISAEQKLRGLDVLRTGDEDILAANALRRVIIETSAKTPTTKQLITVPGTGIKVKMTGVEALALQARSDTQVARFMGNDLSVESRLLRSGELGDWVDSVITPGGRLRREGARLAGDVKYAAIQAGALADGLISGLYTPQEAILNTLMGRASGKHLEHIRGMRRLIGDVSGATLWKRADKVAIHGKRVVALPMEMLLELEQAEMGGARVLSTKLATGGQQVGISAFQYRDGARDIAMTLDLAEDEVTRMTQFIRGNQDFMARYGITDDILRVMDQFGPQFGFQLGIMEGQGVPEVQRAARAFEELGYHLDRKNMRLVTNLLAKPQEFFKAFGIGDEYLATGPALTELPPEALAAMKRSGQLPDYAAQKSLSQVSELLEAIPGIKRNNRALWTAIEHPRSSQLISKIFRSVESKLGMSPKKVAGFAGLAAVAGWIFHQKTRDVPEEDTFAFQGYEDPGYYQMYKDQLNEPVMAGQMRARSAPLDTAGLVQQLDRNKIGHTQYGSGKYDYMFRV